MGMKKKIVESCGELWRVVKSCEELWRVVENCGVEQRKLLVVLIGFINY